MSDLVVRDIGRLHTMAGPVLERAAVVVRSRRVVWSGPDSAVPSGADAPEIDAGGACVVPGFVDAHTHLAWAGDRRAELEARLAGEQYDGGGIHTTVAATSSASDDELTRLVLARLDLLLEHGTTTTEVKTGYGLEPAEELRQLRVVLAAGAASAVEVEATYLAHVPPRGADRAEHVARTAAALPEAARTGARWCDVFCDHAAFTRDEARALLEAGRAAGLGLRLHADQLSRTGGAELAAELGCASADHLEHVDAAGAAALAAAGTVAVLVPSASLTTGQRGRAHADALREAGVTLAISTDCNPGTSWCESMPLVLQLACFELGLSALEALHAATRGGAQALRRPDVGHLGPGARGDLVVLEAEHEVDLVTHLGARAVRATVAAGRVAAGG